MPLINQECVYKMLYCQNEAPVDEKTPTQNFLTSLDQEDCPGAWTLDYCSTNYHPNSRVRLCCSATLPATVAKSLESTGATGENEADT